ncbi:MAG: hypothetical protein JWM65_3844 [Sphingomonas bacterium]|nr:hypothetical protein [Sphingomonas bacterium]
MKLHPDVQRLLDAMRELHVFLSQQGEDFWSGKIAKAADSVAQSDGWGLEQFLGMFGGMGSLNDLVLYNGAEYSRAEDEQLDRMRAKAWNLADQLRHEIR